MHIAVSDFAKAAQYVIYEFVEMPLPGAAYLAGGGCDGGDLKRGELQVIVDQAVAAHCENIRCHIK
jgi:hypothetical protein